MRRLSVAGALVALAGLSLAEGTQACTCAPQGPVEALRRADAAVIARLVRVVPRNRLRADYRYRVQRVYRGAHRIDRGEMIAVRSTRSATTCALPHRLGRRYGLFLAWGEGRWNGGLCGVIAPRRLRLAARRHARGRGMSTASCAG